jgi:polygalacturonase
VTRKLWTLVFIFTCILPGLLSGQSTTPAANPAAADFDVLNYGAVADGKTLNTDAFRAAIQACAAAGGGRVVVPKGTFYTGPIVLMSHVDLHVDAGALVLFSNKFSDYPLIPVNYEGHDTIRCQSPISGDHLDHVSITGQGTFDAQGDFWRPLKRSKTTQKHWDEMVGSGGVVKADGTTWFPSEAARDGDGKMKKSSNSSKPLDPADYASSHELLRPCLLLLSNCTYVTLDGPTFENSPNWNLHPLLCDHLIVRNLTIFNPEYAQNGDGIDIDSCRDVQMSHCDINAGDDGICLKSGRDEEGRRRGRPTEDVTIDNCTVGYAHGGFVIGSEMSGGVRNVAVSHCTFNGTQTGLRFKSSRGRGGVVENIRISDITMTDILGAAITFDMYYSAKGGPATSQPVNDGTPIFRQFQISNVTCKGAKSAIFMRGLPEMPLSQISLENVQISAGEGVSITDANDITLRHVKVDCQTKPPSKMTHVTGLITDDFISEIR